MSTSIAAIEVASENDFHQCRDLLFVSDLLKTGKIREQQVAELLVVLGADTAPSSLVAALLTQGIVAPAAHLDFVNESADQAADLAARFSLCRERLKRVLLVLVPQLREKPVAHYFEAAWGNSLTSERTASSTLLSTRQAGERAQHASADTALTPQFSLINALHEKIDMLQLHGQGGLGEVWRAWDQSLQRCVAVKMLRPKIEKMNQGTDRFLREIRINATLQHPSIVPVYALGSDSQTGRNFYTMRFVEGRDLDSLIVKYHEMPASPAKQRELRRLIDIVKQVSLAIGYAHSQGIIHRDLKPSNIMVGDYGETFVLDWGLAKQRGESNVMSTGSWLQANPELTAAGAILGSPLYMSPEQAQGGATDARTDVYGLGAILFKILTGAAPNGDKNQSLNLLVHRVINFPVKRPSQVKDGVPPVIDAICAKAMAHKPIDRYQSVSELVQDVDNVLAGLPVSVYPESWFLRAVRLGMRHRMMTLVLFVTLFGVLVTLAVTNIQSWMDAAAMRQVTMATTTDDLFYAMRSTREAADDPVDDAHLISRLAEISMVLEARRSGNAAAEEQAMQLLQKTFRTLLRDDHLMLGLSLWTLDSDKPLYAVHRDQPFEAEIAAELGDRSFIAEDFTKSASQMDPGAVYVSPVDPFPWTSDGKTTTQLRVACGTPVTLPGDTKPSAIVEIVHLFDPFWQEDSLEQGRRLGLDLQQPETVYYWADEQGKILRIYHSDPSNAASIGHESQPISQPFPFLSPLISPESDPAKAPAEVPVKAEIVNNHLFVTGSKLWLGNWIPSRSLIIAAATETSGSSSPAYEIRLRILLGGIVLIGVCMGFVILLWRTLMRALNRI